MEPREPVDSQDRRDVPEASTSGARRVLVVAEPAPVPADVLETCLLVACRIAAAADRESGSLLLIGDSGRVLRLCTQRVANPFLGRRGEVRDILERAGQEAVYRFSRLGGAVVIRVDGYIETAAAYPALSGDPELGRRPVIAAGLSGATNATAVVATVDGQVRAYSGGIAILRVDAHGLDERGAAGAGRRLSPWGRSADR